MSGSFTTISLCRCTIGLGPLHWVQPKQCYKVRRHSGSLHGRLFDGQADTTGQNIRSKLINYAATVKALNMTAFKSCLDNEMSLGLVLRDVNLAESNQISGTPTIFIDGRRIDGVRTAAELMAFIDNAKAADNQAVAASAKSGVIPVT